MMRARFVISGIVQGVGFRSFVRRNAEDLGLKGFVRNTEDAVEVVAEGPEEKIKELHELLKKGPSGSRVDNVFVNYEEPQDEFNDFTII